jgi:glycosyltransferase involved in cell wall biosynthesis
LLRELRATVNRLGIAERVRFTGPRSDVPAVMAAADMYCQPNTGPEGFGLTFAEAMRAGLPVVTSAIGGAAEIVTADCGVLCPPGEAGAVADALRGLLVDPTRRSELGASGTGRAAELCDPERQLARLAVLVSSRPRTQNPTAGPERSSCDAE